MQTAAVWRLVKREFPDWYAQRLKEIEALSAAGKDDAAIGQHLARALVTLRRQQVDNALAAQMPNLKRVAAAFLENIVQLRKSSTEACYTFISQGEASPAIVGLLQGSEQVVSLQTQMVAIVEAIADGRRDAARLCAAAPDRLRPAGGRSRQARLDQGRSAALFR